MSKNHDVDEISDGAWWFVYLMIDLAVGALELAFAIVMICIEIACWALAGVFDIFFSMLGFKDDD